MIVLDTHAWIWWNSEPGRLSARAKKAIEQADEVAVSAISTWELSMLVARGRLVLDRAPLQWMQQALARARAALLALSPEVAALSAVIDAHGDPADRIILATAKVHRVPLVSKDARLRRSTEVTTIW